MRVTIAAPKRNHTLLRRAKPLIKEALQLAARQLVSVEIVDPETYFGEPSNGISLHFDSGAAKAFYGIGTPARSIIYDCCWHYLQAIQHAHATRAKMGGWDVSESYNGEVLQ
jgi:hypothetical protein